MKKDYIRPTLAVESFQLDAAIAASCSSDGKEVTTLNFVSTTACAADFYGYAIFSANCGEIPDVGIDITDDDGDDGFCYHAPVSNLSEQFFTS